MHWKEIKNYGEPCRAASYHFHVFVGEKHPETGSCINCVVFYFCIRYMRLRLCFSTFWIARCHAFFDVKQKQIISSTKINISFELSTENVCIRCALIKDWIHHFNFDWFPLFIFTGKYAGDWLRNSSKSYDSKTLYCCLCFHV